MSETLCETEKLFKIIVLLKFALDRLVSFMKFAEVAKKRKYCGKIKLVHSVSKAMFTPATQKTRKLFALEIIFWPYLVAIKIAPV